MDSPGTPNPSSTISLPDDRMSQHLRNMADEAEALLKSTARVGEQKFDAGREQLRDELRHLRARMLDLEASAAASLKSAARRTDAAVHEHPYGAMGIAAAAGLLLGFLIARR